jgi:hypothetical protein
MARTLDDLHPAYIRKYTIATLVMRIAVAVVGKIASRQRRPANLSKSHAFQPLALIALIAMITLLSGGYHGKHHHPKP